MIGDIDSHRIKYLLPDFNHVSYDHKTDPFNFNILYDMSLKYIYDKYNKDFFHIIKMQPVDYLSDVIKPTVKIRFYSRENKQVYFRFDNDNDIKMRNINCTNLFDKDTNKENVLVLIDYNKGYFNKSSIDSLYEYINDNDIVFKKVFINTKPAQLIFYKELLALLSVNRSEITIQLNESEFEPVKDVIFNMNITNVIVTKGKNPITLYTKTNDKYNQKDYSVKNVILNNMHTTSGCGDIYFSGIMYNMIYKEMLIDEAVRNMCHMKQLLKRLNDDIFG